MAVSIANTLTARLWKGEPKVVIRGKFALGLVSYGNQAYFAPNLSLVGLSGSNRYLARPLVSGTSISVQVLGRAAPDWMAVDGIVYSSPSWYSGGSIRSFDDYRDEANSQADAVSQQVQGFFPSNPYANASDGPFFAPKVYFHSNNSLSNAGFNLDVAGEAGAYYVTSDMGSLVTRDLRIVIRGALSALDVTGIAAAGFPPDAAASGHVPVDYRIATTPWYVQRYCSSSDFSPAGVGWRATDVRIYDNPGLRGNVIAGDVPVIWE